MKKGFTLLELLIVILIIGVLAMLAFPQYERMANRSRWSDCVNLAMHIKSAQSLYYAEKGAYCAGTLASLSPFVQMPDAGTRNFRFSIQTANLIYGYHSLAGAADDASPPPTTRFYINLTSNATGYEGNAPNYLQ